MNTLLYIQREYGVRVLSRAFWILTFAVPVVLLAAAHLIMPQQQEVYFAGEEAMPYEEAAGVQILNIAMLLFLFVFFYGAQAMRAVASVRRQRVVELLLQCLRPWQIVVGQIVAIGLVAATQMLIWLLVAMGAEMLLPAVPAFAWHGAVSLSQILISGVWVISGYALYAVLFAIAGVYISEENSTQMVTLLISLIAVGSIYAGIYAIGNPDTPAAAVCRYLPFTSPLIFGAHAMDVTSLTQLLSLCVLWLVTAAALVLGCRYFRRHCLE